MFPYRSSQLVGLVGVDGIYLNQRVELSGTNSWDEPGGYFSLDESLFEESFRFIWILAAKVVLEEKWKFSFVVEFSFITAVKMCKMTGLLHNVIS